MDYYPDERLWGIHRRGGFWEISPEHYAMGYWENYRFDDCIVQINLGWGDKISICPRLLVNPTNEEAQYIRWIALRAIELDKMTIAAGITDNLVNKRRDIEPDDMKHLQAFIDSPIAKECRESFIARVTGVMNQMPVSNSQEQS